MKHIHNVYALRCPISLDIKYIGSTCNDVRVRSRAHMTSNKSRLLRGWLDNIIANKKTLIVEIIYPNIEGHLLAYHYERRAILENINTVLNVWLPSGHNAYTGELTEIERAVRGQNSVAKAREVISALKQQPKYNASIFRQI